MTTSCVTICSRWPNIEKVCPGWATADAAGEIHVHCLGEVSETNQWPYLVAPMPPLHSITGTGRRPCAVVGGTAWTSLARELLRRLAPKGSLRPAQYLDCRNCEGTDRCPKEESSPCAELAYSPPPR